VLVSSCGGPQAGTEPVRTAVAEVRATPVRDLDLLFVIDDSGNTAHLQTNLAAALPAFFTRLGAAIPGGLPGLHVGVVTSDLGTATSAGPSGPPVGVVGQGGCEGSGGGGALTTGQSVVAGSFATDLVLSDGTRQQNFDGALALAVAGMVRVGSTGCGFEQPLASMRAALAENPNNAGFVRPDAVLAVVLLMDEDDCSVRDPALFAPDSVDNPLQSFRCTRFGVTCVDGGNTPDEMNELGEKDRCGPSTSSTALLDDVAPFRDFLVELKGEPRNVVVGGMFGDPTPFVIEQRTTDGGPQSALARSCTWAGPDDVPNTPDDQVAVPGVRLQAFAALFPERAATSSVCSNDLSAPLEDIAQVAAFALGTPCISTPLADSDPALDGVQPDCIVEDLVAGEAAPIEPCPSATCWELLPDETSCPLADHLKLEIRREAAADPSTVTRARCVTR
jgi:hypothetical protein